MDNNSKNYSLDEFLAESISLPLSEIRRQIVLGFCHVNGRKITASDYGIIPGLFVTLGKTITLYT